MADQPKRKAWRCLAKDHHKHWINFDPSKGSPYTWRKGNTVGVNTDLLREMLGPAPANAEDPFDAALKKIDRLRAESSCIVEMAANALSAALLNDKGPETPTVAGFATKAVTDALGVHDGRIEAVEELLRLVPVSGRYHAFCLFEKLMGRALPQGPKKIAVSSLRQRLADQFHNGDKKVFNAALSRYRKQQKGR